MIDYQSNNTTNPMENQEMTPDEAKASLGLATALQEQLIPRQSPEMPQGQDKTGGMQENASQEGTPDLEAKFAQLEKDVKTSIKEEIGGIKDMIKQLLNEEGGEEETNEDENEQE